MSMLKAISMTWNDMKRANKIQLFLPSGQKDALLIGCILNRILFAFSVFDHF